MKKPEARIEPYHHPAAGWGALKYVALSLAWPRLVSTALQE